MLNQIFSFGPFNLDSGDGLMRGKQRLHLTPKAFALLCFLAARRGTLVTKDELFDALWPRVAVGDAALVTCIKELRHALRDDARRPRYIETLHRRGYRFIARTPANHASNDSGSPARLEPQPGILASREGELAQLSEAFVLACTGIRQVVLVSGEAGIGKTTLVRTFLARAALSREPRIAWGQTAEHYGATEAYQPVLDALMRAGRGPWGARLIRVLHEHAPLWLGQMPSLVGVPRARALQRRAAGASRERMQRELTDALEAIAATSPVVLWLEDLHWADVSTIDWLAAFARRPERACLLVIGTYRTGEPSAERHSMHAMRDELRRQGRSRDIVLGPLSAPEVGAYIAARFNAQAGDTVLLANLAAEVHARTEGSPLFMVGILDELMHRGVLACREGAWRVRADASLQGLGIPLDLLQAIDRQIDRLDPRMVRLLETASVAGLEFSAATIAGAADVPVSEVESACNELSRHQQFIGADGTEEWPNGVIASRFNFKHALYRDAFYNRLAAGRRVDLHRRIGELLERGYHGQANQIAAQLAMHFEHGRDLPRSLLYFQAAGHIAVRRSATHEAAAHFERALHLLKTMPRDRARDEQEAALRLALSVQLIANHGMGSTLVETCSAEAKSLCERLGDTTGHFAAQRVLWNHSLMRRPLPQTLASARALMTLAEQSQVPVELALAHRALGCSMLYAGEHRDADRLLARGIRLADRVDDVDFAIYGEHPGMICRAFGAWAKSLMGYPDKAFRLAEAGVEHARRRDDAHGLAFALVTAGLVYVMQRDAPAATRVGAEVRALSREHKLPQWVAFGQEIQGWVACRAGNTAAGLDLMEQAMAQLHATGARSHSSRMLANLAEGYLAAGRPELARLRLDAALQHRVQHGEHYYAPELYRLQALILEAEGAHPQKVGASLMQALAIARVQQAGLLTLRAAVALGKYSLERGNAKAARDLIEPLCQATREGGDLPDFTEALGLLHAVSGVARSTRAAP